MLSLELLYTFLRQKFQLSVKRSFVTLCNVCNFIKQLRLKTDPSLNFISWHDNTSQ